MTSKNKDKKPKTDGDFTNLIGKFGLWHAIILAVVFSNSLFNAFGQLSMAFMLPNVNFSCSRTPEALQNHMSQGEWLRLTQQNDPAITLKSGGYCFRRKLDFYSEENSTESHFADNETEATNFPVQNRWNMSEEIVKCDSWDFDNSVYRGTVAEQWHLMCDNDYLRPIPQAVAMAGLIMGNILVSHFSDQFGRRLSVLCGVVLCALSGLAATLTTNFTVFNAGRFFSSVSKIGIQSSIVIFLETSDASSRWMFSMLNGCGYHIGMLILATTAYHTSTWRILQGGIAAPCLVVLPFLYFVWESPRWLLSKKKIDEGIAVVERIAKMNRVPQAEIDAQIPAIRERYNKLRPPKHLSVVDLFRSNDPKRNNVIITLIMWYLCFAFGILFYSSIFISTTLGAHPHISFCIPVAGELCAIILVALGVRFIRRQVIVFVTACLGGIGFLILGFTDKIFAQHAQQVILRMGAVILIRSSAAAFTQLYPVYSAELYQTPLRNVGIGFCDLMFRLASTVDPFGRYWLPRVHERLLPVLYAGLGFSAAFLALFVPETLNKDLDDGIFGMIKKRASIFSMRSSISEAVRKKKDSVGTTEHQRL